MLWFPELFTHVPPGWALNVAELIAAGKLQECLTAPPDPKSVHKWRVLGTIALVLGIGLILLIIYSAIFGYR